MIPDRQDWSEKGLDTYGWRILHSGIPAEFRSAMLDDFQLRPEAPDVARLKQAVEDYVTHERWKTPYGLLITSRNSQVGKSLAASIIALAALKADLWPVLFVEWPRLRDEALTYPQRQRVALALRDDQPRDLLTEVLDTRLLILDDLGEPPLSQPDWKRDQTHNVIFRIVYERTDAGLATIWTSNYDVPTLSRMYDVLVHETDGTSTITRVIHKVTGRMLRRSWRGEPIYINAPPFQQPFTEESVP